VWQVNPIGTYLFTSESLLKMCDTRDKKMSVLQSSLLLKNAQVKNGYLTGLQCSSEHVYEHTHEHDHVHTHTNIYIPNAFFFLKSCLPLLSYLVLASGSKHNALADVPLLTPDELARCSTDLRVCLLITSWLKISTVYIYLFIHIS
jgi:hypothetical protein